MRGRAAALLAPAVVALLALRGLRAAGEPDRLASPYLERCRGGPDDLRRGGRGAAAHPGVAEVGRRAGVFRRRAATGGGLARALSTDDAAVRAVAPRIAAPAARAGLPPPKGGADR